jgi:23S rRNA (uracil1939-C5)-methyltransferase
MVPGGLCLGHMPDGRVALISGGVPGDEVEFEVDSDKPTLVRGRATRLISPSSSRSVSPCAYVEKCGGCALLPLSREHELAVKLSIIDQALTRTGRFDGSIGKLVEPVRTLGSRVGYRTRMRLQYKDRAIGFFESQSKRLVVVDRCAVASDELSVLLREVRQRLASDDGSFADVEGIELSVFPESAALPEPVRVRSGIVFYERHKSARPKKRPDLTPFHELGSVGWIKLRETRPESRVSSSQRYWILPHVYLRIPLGGFSQVNPGVNRLLIDCVLEAAREVVARSFFDLYGGAGNFTLPLLSAGLRGSLVEVSARSVELAKLSAEEQGLSGGTFVISPVEDAAQALAQGGKQADLVILDPPRAGAKNALGWAYQLARTRLILIGCDPTAFARDLRELVDLGGLVRAIIPFDMFSGTHHVELVAIVDKPV